MPNTLVIMFFLMMVTLFICESVDKYYNDKQKKEVMIECVKVKTVDECNKINF